jgi:hypothetical protein
VKADVLEYLAVLILGVVIGWLASQQGARCAIERPRLASADQDRIMLQRFIEVDTELKRLKEDTEKTIKQLTRELREERERSDRLRQRLTELATLGGPTNKGHGEATRGVPDDWREQP